jgi:hypothetical protein
LVAKEEMKHELQNPLVVHAAMLRGEIAVPNRNTMEHIWGKDPGDGENL